jgi:hypothetical protein
MPDNPASVRFYCQLIYRDPTDQPRRAMYVSCRHTVDQTSLVVGRRLIGLLGCDIQPDEAFDPRHREQMLTVREVVSDVRSGDTLVVCNMSRQTRGLDGGRPDGDLLMPSVRPSGWLSREI